MATKTPKPAEDTKTLGNVLGESFGNAVKRMPIFGGMSGNMTSNAALATGAIGVFGKALGEAKSVFLDPIISTAKGGFQAGLSKGMGLDTFGKTFSMLGTVVGMQFAPAIILASAAVMTFARNLSEKSISISKVKDGFDKFMDNGGALWNPGLGILRYLAKPIAKSALGDNYPEEMVKNMKIAQKSFELSLRGKQTASYSDLSSVREQIALAANNIDPIEREQLELQKKMFPQVLQQIETMISFFRGN